MPQNGLKLHDNKTEYLLLHSKNLIKPSPPAITIGDGAIAPSHVAKNLGIIFDDTLSLRLHIAGICKSSVFQLHKISQICSPYPFHHKTSCSLFYNIQTELLQQCAV